MPVFKSERLRREWLVVLCDEHHANLTHQQIADKIAERFGYQFSRSLVTRWMNGDRDIFADVIFMLAEVLGQSCDDLCKWEYDFRKKRDQLSA